MLWQQQQKHFAIDLKIVFLFFVFYAAKNQGLAIGKNSASTTIHNEQSFGPSQQTSANSRFNVESRSVNGFQTTKNELDIAMLQILDPHLRPVPPVPHEPTSQKIYTEHMALAQEYFKVRNWSLKRLLSWNIPLFHRTKQKSPILQNTKKVSCRTWQQKKEEKDSTYATSWKKKWIFDFDKIKEISHNCLNSQEALMKLESHLKSQLEIVNNHRNQEVANEAILWTNNI